MTTNEPVTPQPKTVNDVEAPAVEPTTVPATKTTTAPAPESDGNVKGSLAGGTWVALIVGSLLLILLLVFILQNQEKVEMNLFVWSFSFPAGVGFLLTAIAGALIMALVGAVRMFQLRRQIKKSEKN